jgi:hypothetical protein
MRRPWPNEGCCAKKQKKNKTKPSTSKRILSLTFTKINNIVFLKKKLFTINKIATFWGKT